MEEQKNVSVGLGNLSHELRLSGALHESEAAARRTLLITRQLRDQNQEGISLCWLGLVLTARGMKLESANALDRSLAFARQSGYYLPYDYQAIRAVCFGEYADAQALANRAMTYLQEQRIEARIILSPRLQRDAALGLADHSPPDDPLHHSLTRARTVNLVEAELHALVGLAELRP